MYQFIVCFFFQYITMCYNIYQDTHNLYNGFKVPECYLLIKKTTEKPAPTNEQTSPPVDQTTAPNIS